MELHWGNNVSATSASPLWPNETQSAGNSSEEADDRRMVVELLRTYLGARHRSLAESIVLTIVYSAIFLTGVVGNVCTCIVIIKNSYMHTATNYYLFSLAISDVLTLILGLPPEVYTIWEAYPWRFGEPYCLFKTFLTEMTSSASVLTITSFTIERYVAICHPIRAQTMSSLSRAIKIVFGIWICACLTALPYPIHTRTYHYLEHPVTNQSIPDSLICNIPLAWLPRMRYMFQVSSIILFILPMTVITGLYILIGLTLRRSSMVRQASSECGSSPPGLHQSRKAVLKMLVAVVVAFFICWAPYHAQRLMTAYISDHQWTPTLMEIQSILFYISGILYFVSSTVNPILYNLMSKKYRQAFKETLCRCCLTADERRQYDSRLRGYYISERSTTYTMAGGNTRLLPNKSSHRGGGGGGSGAGGGGVNRQRDVVKIPRSNHCMVHRMDGKKSSNSKWGSWKEKLLGRNGKDSIKGDSRSQARAANSAKYVAAGIGPDHQAPNGSTAIYSDTTSHSASSSPERTALDIREEMELSDVELPSHQRIICPRTGSHGNSGTLL